LEGGLLRGGPNRGVAAHIGRVAHSAQEVIKIRPDESIDVELYDQVFATIHPDDTITFDSKVSEGRYTHPSNSGAIAKALGVMIMSKVVKGMRQPAVYFDEKFYKFHKGLKIKGGEVLNPEPFMGIRVNKEATKKARENFEDFFSIFKLTFNPDPKASRVHLQVPPIDALADKDQWADLMQWLCSEGKQRWVWWTGREDEKFRNPDEYRAILLSAVQVKETFDTGIYSLGR
jgi:hypothetical protein